MDNRGIATLYGDAYATTVPRVLGDQHKFLLDSLEAGLAGKNAPVLLVLGPGGYVLPYSCKYTEDGKLGTTNRDRVKKIVGNGKIVLLDYILESENSGLEKEREVLTEMGFFEPGYFKEGLFLFGETICPTHTPSGTISFILNDLRQKLRVASDSVDAVDANLSIHHASITRAELRRVYNEIYRVLKPGGMLHLGEGNVNMNHTEDKIVRIGQDVAEINNAPVYFSDYRHTDLGCFLNAVFEPGKKYDCLPVVNTLSKQASTMIVTGEGNIVLQTMADAEKTTKELQDRGYFSARPCGRTSVVMPLIDHLMSADVESHIKPVDGFYDAILARINKGYAGVADELVERISGAVEEERKQAKKGIVEYYMGEQQILGALQKAGFSNINVHRVSEPFYNIIAVKP